MLLGVNPFHHAAKLLAGFFDRVVSLTTLNGLKAGLIRLVLQDPYSELRHMLVESFILLRF